MSVHDGGIGAGAFYTLELALAFVFLFAALPKVRNPRMFVQTVVDYDLMPVVMARLVSLGLIGVELFLAFAFATGFLLQIAVPLALGTLVTFAAAVAINVRRDRRVACGCFGNPNEKVSTRTLVRLVMLMFAASILLIVDLGGVAPRTAVASLVADDESGLRYVLEIGTLAGFLILSALWMLNLPEVAALGGRSQRGSRAEPMDRRTEAA